ncbi:multidrug effflux MFS transporter [Moheibacter sediminis]|uniref:MFS transporter, DHA1 family, bicyclomycin/chloramphenicol resistance protein n=1 Tax=Moheibacter sediminis TaxID=1434700 RepID=A0A1W2AG25_9FLAO|nr:multidrug effflux MFS transporter [Moheibacter sediminis]SMC59442.1 MFS transporter, DHA1 family, bicyclomycin/chloramphenicol resistance protein [Moheibacter sediminis]
MQHTTINKNFLIILLGILAALGPFTIDMYLPGFQRIAEDFYTDEKHVAFTLTSYFVGIAVGQLIYGPIVDKYGRKKPLLFGLAIYILASLGCAFSVNIEMMIGMRLLQALGGCVGMVASNAIISDVYAVDKRAKAFSYIMLVMGVAPLIAPTAGSLFIEKADWNYIFFFLAVFAGLVSAMIYFLLPETSLYMHSNKLRIRKISKDYFEIFKNRSFLMYTLAGSIAMSILFAYISSASFVFLTLYKLDKGTFSILFAINASGLISGSYLNGVLNKYVDYIKIANLAAIILSVISILILILINVIPEMPYQWVVAGLFLILFSTGFINPNATAASLAPFTNNAGAASALGGSIRMGVGAVVAATIGIFQGNSANTMFITMCGLAISATIFLHIAQKVVRK